MLKYVGFAAIWLVSFSIIILGAMWIWSIFLADWLEDVTDWLRNKFASVKAKEGY